MTILDLLNSMNVGNNSMEKALGIIKDDFTSLVNENYELVINENRELNVKIPSLQKRDEYVYSSISEYQYPLVMCMRIENVNNPEKYKYILSKFMEFYSDKLDLFLKDVNTVNKLKENIINVKNRIDYTTYASIVAGVIGAIVLCIFDLIDTAKYVTIIGTIVFFVIALIVQVTKEKQVKKSIDAYLSVIKTDWYKNELTKEYAFFCHYME